MGRVKWLVLKLLGLGGSLLHNNSDKQTWALEVKSLRQVVLALGLEPSDMRRTCGGLVEVYEMAFPISQ